VASIAREAAASTAEAADTNSDLRREKLLREGRGFFHSRMLLAAGNNPNIKQKL
jgi:hypothetical protein